MFGKFLILLALCVFSASATVVSQCKGGEPFPLSVDIKGCVAQPCDVVKGSVAVMDVHFVGTRDNLNNLKTVVHATTLGITVPYELPADVADVCSNLLDGASCPIDESEDVVYRFNFFVDNTYPEIGVKVKVNIVDESKASVACFTVDIKVKKGVNRIA